MKKYLLYFNLNKVNYWWQNFIEDMFGMGNFTCPTYKSELRKVKKNKY